MQFSSEIECVSFTNLMKLGIIEKISSFFCSGIVFRSSFTILDSRLFTANWRHTSKMKSLIKMAIVFTTICFIFLLLNTMTYLYLAEHLHWICAYVVNALAGTHTQIHTTKLKYARRKSYSSIFPAIYSSS